MKVFLIVLAVILVIFCIILSLKAEFEVVYDNGWHSKIRVLFIEKDVQISKILQFLLFPEKAAQDVIEEKEEEKEKDENPEKKKQKKSQIKKILDEDGVVGLMLLISNLLQTAGSALSTLIKGLHIYSLYVKMIIGGGDAADIAEKYGNICGYYYPIKGYILHSLKVDMYDDFIQPDFIAPSSEYEFQFIASINVALLLKVAIKAGIVFLKNLLRNK
ncbi:MAG: hypothetical protein E7570_06710 [Ruminococcaceae bacterium]|nr:hypothetical protein [Oscillospiraceae bacterium]